MKSAFLWGTAALFAFTMVVRADEPKVKVQAPGVRVEANAPAAAPVREVNSKDFKGWRASKFIGANVQNSEMKSLGTVNDMIVDSQGRTHYIILAHGGVLGVGQKLFAIPMSAVTFAHNQDETPYVRFDIKPEILDKADGFTSEKWPDFSNNTWRKDNDEFYTKNGVKVHVDVNNPPANR